MIRRSTFILLIFLVIAVGLYFYIQNRPIKATVPTPTISGTNLLITEEDGTLVKIQINDTSSRVIVLEQDLNSLWMIVEPISSEADQSKVNSVESQINSLIIITKLETSPELNSIGLDPANYIIRLRYSNGNEHKLEIGSPTPLQNGYYVRLDDGDIYAVGQSIQSVISLLDVPPFAPTETPTPTLNLTETITPTFESTYTSSP